MRVPSWKLGLAAMALAAVASFFVFRDRAQRRDLFRQELSDWRYLETLLDLHRGTASERALALESGELREARDRWRPRCVTIYGAEHCDARLRSAIEWKALPSTSTAATRAYQP